MTTRIEMDTLGTMEVPADALYGPQTARAVVNFPISGLRPHPALVRATVIIKKAAARANASTGRLPADIADAIIAAADEVIQGRFADQFVVDPFQAGAGTSHNMNANEVLANRAAEILGGKRGDYNRVNPNDHVNMAQSTNDVFPTAMRLSCLQLLNPLLEVLQLLRDSLRRKGVEFDDILKSGRTHLQDAVPIRLGQEFEAYAVSVERNIAELERTTPGLLELGIGGTAVGTGLNAEKAYIPAVVAAIAGETGFHVTGSRNMVETMNNMAPFVSLSSALKGLGVNIARIAEDLRLLSSGPRTGLAEITLPPVQPGSSIMPGKVNPVIAEMTSMVCFQAVGADATVTAAAQAGRLQLNVMMPVIAYNLLFVMEILTNALRKFATACIDGITADRTRCRTYMETSVGLVTVLAPYLGYAAAAEVAKESVKTGRSIRDIIISSELLSEHELAAILDPLPLTNPGVPGKREA